MNANLLLAISLTIAWLAPLAGTVIVWGVGGFSRGSHGKWPARIAISTVSVSLVASIFAVWQWYSRSMATPVTGVFYEWAQFQSLDLAIEYYIDGLTVVMFGVVTLIATAVHVFSVAYMDDGLADEELAEAVRGHEGDLSPAEALHDAQPTPENPQLRRYFALLQFFTFAMLGLVLAGNLLQVFVFWELVGAASYFLIGFHFERPHAAMAATKAFVMNRIGDAGFLVGMMALWTVFGTLSFVAPPVEPSSSSVDVTQPMPAPGLLTHAESAKNSVDEERTPWSEHLVGVDQRTALIAGYSNAPQIWMVIAGLGLFAGCIGKSAQLPLSTWLPDAMAGPTPVSALVHSATMVAAGVYLIGRLFPLFVPDVQLVIAYVGMATLLYGAVCATVQTDLKRILAFSTISQLGYMMLAMGVGSRDAGLFHLITHAFFKSLLFLCVGSVIVALHHIQDLSQMGGLRKTMPITAYAALVGVIAISGLAVPFVSVFGEAIAFSGFHSKDAVLAAAHVYADSNPNHALLFWIPLVTAGLTAFYMFRLWWLAFGGTARNEQIVAHASDGSLFIKAPLIVLALFAAFCGVGGEESLGMAFVSGREGSGHIEHSLLARYERSHHTAMMWGLVAAWNGAIAAYLVYGMRSVVLRPLDGDTSLKASIAGGMGLDHLYGILVVSPAQLLGGGLARFDQVVVDGGLHIICRSTLGVSRIDRWIDEYIVDGLVNWTAASSYAVGRSLRSVQTGQLRQYVVALAVATIALFAIAIIVFPRFLGD